MEVIWRHVAHLPVEFNLAQAYLGSTLIMCGFYSYVLVSALLPFTTRKVL